MTTDNFTDAMFAASRENNPHRDPQFGEFRAGAEWARTHLAAQEPTDAEVEAVADVLAESEDTGSIETARAALSAARNARRDEETPMSKWTRHGHEIPGVLYDPREPKPPRARCGGSLICPRCASDVARHRGDGEAR